MVVQCTLCDLQTDTQHIHSLVVAVCLFLCAFPPGFEGFHKVFILVLQLYFTHSFISNSLSHCKGKNPDDMSLLFNLLSDIKSDLLCAPAA